MTLPMVRLIFLLISSMILISTQLLPKNKTINLQLNRTLITPKIPQKWSQTFTMKIRPKTMIPLKLLLTIINLQMITHLTFYNAISLNLLQIQTTTTYKVTIFTIRTLFPHKQILKIFTINLLVKNSKLIQKRMIPKTFRKE